jgi:hypothetical protein
MKKIVISIVLVFLITCFSSVNAQDYQTAIGIRGGYTSGINLQFWTDENRALDGTLSFRNNGMQMTILIEHYRPILLKRSTHIFGYWGWGGHLGYDWGNSSHQLWDYPPRVFRSGPVLGIDAVLGAEYRFYKVPITLGLDFKPFAEFSATRFFNLNLWDFGLTARYTFNKKK